MEYLIEHIRTALADRAPHQMGLALHVDAEEIRVRGPIDSEADREVILDVVRDLAEGRVVVDDLHHSETDPNPRTERLP